MRATAFIFAFTLLASAPSFADEVPIDGLWVGTYTNTSIQQEGDFSMRLLRNGSVVTGTMDFKNRTTGRGFENVPVKGTTEGSKVSLRVGRNGQGWLEGTVSGDAMTGKTAGSDNLPANDFRAKKQ